MTKTGTPFSLRRAAIALVAAYGLVLQVFLLTLAGAHAASHQDAGAFAVLCSGHAVPGSDVPEPGHEGAQGCCLACASFQALALGAPTPALAAPRLRMCGLVPSWREAQLPPHSPVRPLGARAPPVAV